MVGWSFHGYVAQAASSTAFRPCPHGPLHRLSAATTQPWGREMQERAVLPAPPALSRASSPSKGWPGLDEAHSHADSLLFRPESEQKHPGKVETKSKIGENGHNQEIEACAQSNDKNYAGDYQQHR